MSASITVAGIDVTAYVQMDAVEVDESPTQSLFEMDFTMRITRQATPVPQPGNEVVWTYDGTREFGGEVLTVKETMITPDTFEYEVKATDYTRMFGRKLVVQSYDMQDADLIVKDIVTNVVNPGLPVGVQFTTHNVQSAPLAAQRKIDHLAANDAVKRLADELSWTWYVDYYRDVHFFPIESFPSPLPSNTLNADTDIGPDYADLVLTLDGSQVKNRIYVYGFSTNSADTIQDTWDGDGSTTTFHLSQTPASLTWATPTVTVGVDAYIPKIDVADGLAGSGGPSTNAYFNAANMTLRFDTPPGSGTANVTAKYKYTYMPVVMIEDPQAQWAMAKQDGGDGTYEYAVNDNTLTAADTSLADARGSLLLLKYAYTALTGTMTSYTQGWRAGQCFTLTSAARMGGIPAKPMWVLKVRKTIVNAIGGAQMLRYDLDISDRPYAF